MKKLNNKTRKISLRLSENALNIFDEEVNRMGLRSRSALIRLLMSQKKERIKVVKVCISDEITKDLIREINRIGVNINQIARKLNALKIGEDITPSLAKLGELQEQLEKKVDSILNLPPQKNKEIDIKKESEFK